MKQIITITATIFFLAGCSSKDYTLLQSDQKITTEPRVVQTEVIDNTVHTVHGVKPFEYRILPQDRLAISLYKNPEYADAGGSLGTLSSKLNGSGTLVDSRGYIVMPLIGRVKVAGLTQSNAAKRITHRYEKYLKDPGVYLEVLNKRVYVLGEVNVPGVVPLKGAEKIMLLELIAATRGFSAFAVRDNIIVLSHNDKGQMTIRKVDLTKMSSFHHLTNMVIKPNDVVYVQSNAWRQFQVASGNSLALMNFVTKSIELAYTVKNVVD